MTQTQKSARQQHAGWNTILEAEARQLLTFGTQVYMHSSGEAALVNSLLETNSHPIAVSAKGPGMLSKGSLCAFRPLVDLMHACRSQHGRYLHLHDDVRIGG